MWVSVGSASGLPTALELAAVSLDIALDGARNQEDEQTGGAICARDFAQLLSVKGLVPRRWLGQLSPGTKGQRP